MAKAVEKVEHLPRNRHHGLSQERRPARCRAADGQSRKRAHPGLYDGRSDEVSLDEVERIGI